MRKRLSALLVSTICAFSLGLVACGGSSGSAAAPGEAKTEPEAVEKVVDPSEKFLGTWKLAAAETNGIVFVGNFEMALQSADGIVATINEDGTGTLATGDDSSKFNWTLTSDDVMTITNAEADKADGDAATDASDDAATDDAATGEQSEADEIISDTDSMTLTYKDDALILEPKDEEIKMLLTFSKDGTLKDIKPIDYASATPVKETSELVGDWGLGGMSYNGATIYGDVETLGALTGIEGDFTMKVSEDGTAVMFGQPVSLVTEDGVVKVDPGNETNLPLYMVEQGVIVHMTPGVEDTDVAILFTKQ